MGHRNRLIELDAMRGIAAALVVLFHATENLPDGFAVWVRLLRATPLRPLLDGRQSVVFFFVLSGLALTLSLLDPRAPGYAGFLWRRLIRLCLPTAAAVMLSSLAYGLFYAPGPWLDPNAWMAQANWTLPPTPKAILLQSLLIGFDGDFSLDPVLWSLVHEIRLSLLLPLVLLAATPGSDWARLLLPGAFAALSGLNLADRIYGENQLGASASAIATALLYFALPIAIAVWAAIRSGLASALRPPEGGWRRCHVLSLAGCAVAGFAIRVPPGAIGHPMIGGSPMETIFFTLYFAPCFLAGAGLALGGLGRFEPDRAGRAFCLAGFIALLCFDGIFATVAASVAVIVLAGRPGAIQTVLRIPALCWLGKVSFSLYLVHLPLLLALRHGLEGYAPASGIFALWLAICLPAAGLFHALAEAPAQRLARAMGGVRHAAGPSDGAGAP